MSLSNGSSSNGSIARRRSNRIQQHNSSNLSQQSRSHNGHGNNGNNHNNRSMSNRSQYAGQKRTAPDDSSSDDDDSSDASDTSQYTNNSTSVSTINGYGRNGRNGINHNGRNGRRGTQILYSQRSTQGQGSQTQLASQIPASQMNAIQRERAKKRKLDYQVTTEKWKQNQSNIQRRSTRLRYRKLADDTHDNRAAIVDPMSNQFMDKLEEQNKIYEDVCHPNEAFMDIEQAKNMTNILKEQTRTLANEQFTITPNDYISALQREFGKDEDNSNGQQNGNGSQHIMDDDELIEIDWAAIGSKFASWFLTVPAIQFMNGPLQQCEKVPEVQKKVRQVRQKKTFTTDAPVVQPKKVVKQKKADKTETKSRVTHLKKVLRKKCEDQDGVNPFEFLINPESYSQTIENLFDMSFIMKEGFAQMDVNNESQQPVLSYVSSAERTRRHTMSNNGKRAKTNGQCIVKFNPQTFCSLIDTYNIEQSQIQRADANDTSDEDGDDSDSDDSDEKSGSSDDDESEEDDQPIARRQRRRGGLGGKRGRGRGRAQVNGHSNGHSNGVRGRGRRRRNNDKEEAD